MHRKLNAIVDKNSGRIIVQTPLPPLNCVAFEAGGVACASHAGVIQVMEKYGVLDDIEYVSGVSGGALAALGLCLGYTAEEMTTMLSSIPMDKFMERSESWWITPRFLSNLRKILSIWNSSFFALSSGKVFREWVQQIVEAKMGNKNATFRDLANKIEEEKREFGSTRKKKLFIGGTDLSIQPIPEVKVLSVDTEPDMPLADAAYISALYPFVFAPFEYKGHLWGDGGIRSLLLTKTFDDEKYLPKGFGFTTKGVNPGVLAVKVDTPDEIKQLQSGVQKEVKINKTSEYAYQVANATAHNTDIDEIREARTTIFLADGDVDRLNLYLPQESIMQLVDEAVDTSKEFFENYMDAAYEVISYAGIKEWLEAISRDEHGEIATDSLDTIIEIYKSMLNKLLADPEEARARDKLAAFDPSKPTIFQLENQIRFLKEYRKAKRKLKKNSADEDLIKFPAFPEHHINIAPEFPKSIWHKKIREDMEKKVAESCLPDKIHSAEGDIAKHKKELGDVIKIERAASEKSDETFAGYHDEKVKTLALYGSYLDKLRDERDTIECKLGIKADYHTVNDKNNSNQYAALYEISEELSARMNLSSALRSVILQAPPLLVYETDQDSKIDLRIDLRRVADRKIYLIAAALYLEKRKAADKHLFKSMLETTFLQEDVVPANAGDLVRMLGQDDVDLHVSLFKIEHLLHYFEKTEYPKYEPVMSIRSMFGLSKFSMFAQPKAVSKGDIEMRVIIGSEGKNERSDYTPPSNPGGGSIGDGEENVNLQAGNVKSI